MHGLRVFIILTRREDLGGYLQITPTSLTSVFNEKRQLKLPFILMEQYTYSTGSIIS